MVDCVCKHEEGENRNELPGTDTGPASHGMCSGVDVSVDASSGLRNKGLHTQKI